MNDNELLRRLDRIGWRLDAIDNWRKESDSRVAVLESIVNDLRFTDALAQALADKLDHRHRFDLTVLQKIGAGAFAIALVAIPTLTAKFL